MFNASINVKIYVQSQLTNVVKTMYQKYCIAIIICVKLHYIWKKKKSIIFLS